MDGRGEERTDGGREERTDGGREEERTDGGRKGLMRRKGQVIRWKEEVETQIKEGRQY